MLGVKFSCVLTHQTYACAGWMRANEMKKEDQFVDTPIVVWLEGLVN